MLLRPKVEKYPIYNLSLKIRSTGLRASDIERIGSDTDKYNVLIKAYNRFKLLLELYENTENYIAMISTDLSVLEEYIQNLSRPLNNDKGVIFPSEAFNRLATEFNELVKTIAQYV